MLFIDNSTIHGKGVFTDTLIKKDEHIGLVCFFNGKWITCKWASFVNHASPGNASVEKIGDEIHLFAHYDILPDKEIASDYFAWNRDIDCPKLDTSFL